MNLHVFALSLLICIMFVKPSDCWWRRRRSTPSCQVSGWSSWTACSKTCGAGTKTRSRHKTRSGYSCPSFRETVSCKVHDCCAVSSWSVWGACSATCDNGKQKRTRIITKYPSSGGTKCPSLLNDRNCRISFCPIDCEVDNWSQYSHCSKSCGHGGVKTRKRVITKHPLYGGNKCPATIDTVPCGTICPPINCVVGSWSIFGACSKTCGHGFKLRSRIIVHPAENGGAPCPVLEDKDLCVIKECRQDCEVFDWGDYGSCDVTCGSGTKTRTRAIKTHPAHGGHLCPSLVERTSCLESLCPVDCKVTAWTDWTDCKGNCGSEGIQQRGRNILNKPSDGGKACPIDLEEEKACDIDPCPINCKYGQWSRWSACSSSCGSGRKKRTRDLTQPQYGGKKCWSGVQTKSCQVACPKCKVSNWSPWSTCEGGCKWAAGKSRSREVTSNSANKTCPKLKQQKKCYLKC